MYRPKYARFLKGTSKVIAQFQQKKTSRTGEVLFF